MRRDVAKIGGIGFATALVGGVAAGRKGRG
jgi:hypothetical protein